jgi:taurine dioxygenase
VLFFRDQPITPQQQARFAANFGDLHIHPIYPNVPEQPEVLILDTAVTDVRDNAIWHTDVTFLPTPAMGAVLSAKLLPAFGGDTCGPAALRRTRLVGAAEACSRADRHPRLHKSFPLERWQHAEDLARWEETRARTRRCRTRWCARTR